MIFRETKTAEGYEYYTEDFVGTFTFQADKKLTGNVLDGCVLKLSSGESQSGTIKAKDVIIRYTFTKSNQWIED